MRDKLTENFYLREFVKQGTNVPLEDYRNLELLANRLQTLRDVLGKPIKINSGYRTPSQNAAVGGASNSQHLYGRAADIQLSNEDQKKLNLQFGWSGGYGKGDNWCHLDIRKGKARWSY